MARKITARSREQFLEDIIRHVVANDTDITDFKAGGQLVTVAEAVSTKLFQMNLDLLRILENGDIDSMTREQLSALAEDMLLPNKSGGVGAMPATRSVVQLAFSDTSFSRTSTLLYAGKTAPFAGSAKLYVDDAEAFPATGEVFIGRGTEREEGPVAYSSKTQFEGFWYLELTTPLLFDHPYSDEILLSQGGNRTIFAGQRVFASGTSPAVYFSVDRTVEILPGETEVLVKATAVDLGVNGNVEAGKIDQLESGVQGVTVTNREKAYGGRDVENRSSLLLRIKKWQRTLSRSTTPAIVAQLQGLSDTTDTIESVSAAPQVLDEPLRVYVNNGSLLEPTIEYHSFETLTRNASGRQKTFTLNDKPVTPPFVESSEGNFRVADGQELVIQVNGKSYTFTIREEFYRGDLAKPYEIVNNFNAQNTEVLDWRTIDSGRRVIAMARDAERIECESGDLQKTLGLPVGERRAIYVYVDGVLKNSQAIPAEVETQAFAEWDLASYSSDFFTCNIEIDEVPLSFNVTNQNFARFGTTFTTASAEQWAQVFDSQIPGCEVLVRSGRLAFRSTGGEGSIRITGGNWLNTDAVWSPFGELEAEGEAQHFVFNRFTGEIRFVDPVPQYSEVTVATKFTRANILSQQANQGIFEVFGNTTFVRPYLFVALGGVVSRLITPTAASVVEISSDHTNKLMILEDTADENLFGEVHPGDDFLFVMDQDSNPESLRFGTTGTWAPLEGVYKVVRTLKNGESVTQIELQATDSQLTIVDDLITPIVVTDGMFSSYQTENRIEFAAIPENNYDAEDLVVAINSLFKDIAAQVVTGNQIRLYSKSFDTSEISVIKSYAGAVNVFTPSTGEKLAVEHVASSSTGVLNRVPTVSESVSNGFQRYLKFETTAFGVAGSALEYTGGEYPKSTHLLGLQSQDSVIPAYSTQKTAPYNGTVTESVTSHAYLEEDPFVVDIQDVTLTQETRDNNVSTGVFGSGLGISDLCNISYATPESVKVLLQKRYEILELTNPSVYEPGSVLSFKLKDPNDLLTEGDSTTGRPIFDLFHPLRKSTLEGCKIATRSMAFYESNGSAIVLRSLDYGGKSRLRLGFRVSDEESTEASVSHFSVNNPEDGFVDTHAVVTLGSSTLAVQGLMEEGSYSVTWGAPIGGVADVVFDSESPAISATADTPVGDMVIEAQTPGEDGNGIVFDVVDNSSGASVESGVPGIEFIAIPGGTNGNGISVVVSDSGTGGLSISEDIGAKQVTIELGGDTNVTRLRLQEYATQPTLVSFGGDGYSASLVVSGPQVLTGGTGSGLNVSEDTFAKTVTVDLGGDSVDVQGLQDFLTLNPISLVNVLGNAGDLTVFTSTLAGGSEATFGPFADFVVGDAVNFRGSLVGLPVGTWIISSKTDGKITCKVPFYTGSQDFTSVNAYENPVRSYSVQASSVTSAAALLNEYGEENDLWSAEAIGVQASIEEIVLPSWELNQNGDVAARIDTVGEAVSWHDQKGIPGGEARIFEYDPDNTVQALVSGNKMFPTDEFGAAPYVFESESVMVMPDDTYSLNLWLNTHIHSTLSSFCDVEGSKDQVVVSSRQVGSDSSIEVLETTALSGVEAPLQTDISEDNGVGRFTTSDQMAQTWIPGTILRIKDKKDRVAKLGYGGDRPFDKNQAIYTRDAINLKKARIVFLRRGQFDDNRPEPLHPNDEITFTDLGDGRVKLTHTGSGQFDARVGEMMFVPNLYDTFPADIETKGVGNRELVTSQPVIQYPSNGEDFVPNSITVTTEPFKAVPSGQLHVFTDWRAKDESGTIVWDSLGDGINLTSIEIPLGVFETGNDYTIECRFYGQISGYSIWSFANQFTVRPRDIEVPQIVFPANGASNVSRTTSLRASEFVSNPPGQLHTASSWELYDEQGELVWSSYDNTVNLYEIQIPSGIMNLNEQYRPAVRFHSDIGAVSDWSGNVVFTTLDGSVTTPVIINPLPGSVGVSNNPTFTISDFVANPEGQAHVSTSWELAKDGVIIFTSENDKVNLRSITIQEQYFDLGETYEIRARVEGSISGLSNWSAWSVFTVLSAAVDTPSVVSPFNGQTNTNVDLTIQLSSFSAQPSQSQVSSDFEIYSDVEMTNLVWSAYGSTGSSIQVPNGVLSTESTYYVRGKQNGSLAVSAWSSLNQFSTLVGSVSAPAVVAPSSGSSDQSLTPTLQTSSFSSNPAQSHISTSWYLYSNAALTNLIWSSENNTSDLTSISVPSGILSEGQTAWATASHTGNNNGNSGQGAASQFDTVLPPPVIDPPPQPGPGTGELLVRRGLDSSLHFHELLEDGTLSRSDVIESADVELYQYGAAMSGDGQWLAVSVDIYSDSSRYDPDAKVLIMQRSGSTFVESEFVSRPSPNATGVISLNLDQDGDTLVVGWNDADHPFTVYKKTGGSWNPLPVGAGGYGFASGGFGNQVAVSPDGNTVCVGVQNRDPYVFVYDVRFGEVNNTGQNIGVQSTNDIVFSPDGSRFAVAHGNVVSIFAVQGSYGLGRTIDYQHSAPVRYVRFTADNLYVVGCDAINLFILQNIPNGSFSYTIQLRGNRYGDFIYGIETFVTEPGVQYLTITYRDGSDEHTKRYRMLAGGALENTGGLLYDDASWSTASASH